MTQDNQQDPIDEAGGYGTPTAEQELPGAQNQDNAGQPGAGRSGDTEEQVSTENTAAGPDYDADGPENAETVAPSSEAEMDESNTEEPDAGRPFSSEPGQDAAGLPDGSGTDLPESKSPKDSDDDEAAFDAG